MYSVCSQLVGAGRSGHRCPALGERCGRGSAAINWCSCYYL